MAKQQKRYCRRCRRETFHEREKFLSNGESAFLGLMTFGIASALNEGTAEWRCMEHKGPVE